MDGQLLLRLFLIKFVIGKENIPDHVKESNSLDKTEESSRTRTNVLPRSEMVVYNGGKIFFVGDKACDITATDGAFYGGTEQGELQVPKDLPLYMGEKSYIRFSVTGTITFTGQKDCSVEYSKGRPPAINVPKSEEDEWREKVEEVKERMEKKKREKEAESAALSSSSIWTVVIVGVVAFSIVGLIGFCCCYCFRNGVVCCGH